jgi:peptidylprolyl isomerase
MSDTPPPNRNPKRQRKKEGAQARRAAEMAALRRQQRNRRMVRVGVLAGVVIAGILLISALGGDDDKDTADVASDSSSTTAVDESPTTSALSDVTPMACDAPSGDENTDMTTKPTVTVPEAPVTELQCQDLVVGDGDEVTSAGDTVQVHYVGVSQSTGEEFDTSWGGEPIEFALTGVISGWTNGLPGMKVGGRRLLTIPADQAYGDDPSTGRPTGTLVFVIDLLSVTKLAG